MTNPLTRKVRFEGTPRLDPYWKLRPVELTYKVDTEWKSELNLWTTTILTRGSVFLMTWTNWSQTWSTRSTTTTSRRPLQRRRKYLRLQADPWPMQNQKDLQLIATLQGLSYSWKNMVWFWNKSWIRSSLPSGKKTQHSSSTRRNTARRRWSD